MPNHSAFNDPSLEPLSESSDGIVENSVPVTSFIKINLLELKPTSLQLWCLILFLAVTDFVLYLHPFGYAGWGAWLILTSILAAIGIGVWGQPLEKKSVAAMSMLAIALICTSIRFVYQGNLGLFLISFVLIQWWALVLHRIPMEWWRLVVFFATWMPSGVLMLPATFMSGGKLVTAGQGKRVLAFAIPLAIGALFCIVFLNANPESLSRFYLLWEQFSSFLWGYLGHLHVSRFLFWIFMGILALGLLFPICLWGTSKNLAVNVGPVGDSKSSAGESGALWSAIKCNTLILLNLLFAVYLCGEFSSMWFRDFPKGFHFSGYAHRGAAWLTLALAMATGLLSVFFRNTSNLPSGWLRKLAQIWSALNVLLAVCVYNRLAIYVAYNGMTTLRVVGFLGVTCVLIGFILVVLKIHRRWTFDRLINLQLWTVAIAAFLFAVLPIDNSIHRYNCWRILNYDDAPSVQLHVQRISPAGWIELVPLVDSSESEIREGVRAMLASEYSRLEANGWGDTDSMPWQEFQISEYSLMQRLRSIKVSHLDSYLESEEKRNSAIEVFRERAMEWF